jgi:hypothetical protein
VLWCYAAASAIGVLLGTRYRIPALVLATWLVVLAAFGTGLAIGSPAGRNVMATLAAVLALQIGYIAGVLLTYIMSKTDLRRFPRGVSDRPNEHRTRQDHR